MVGFVVLVGVLTRVRVSGSPFSASEYRFGVKGQWSKMSMSSQEVAGKQVGSSLQGALSA